MKLRIYQDSIRFRVQKPEIDQLKSDGVVQAFISLGNDVGTGLYYEVKLAAVDVPVIDFSGNKVSLSIPQNNGLKWCEGNDVGIYGQQIVADGKLLKILLEKDFKCLDDTFEDQSDMFPNPKEKC